MDNLPRDNNSSILPMAGVVVGALALLVGGIAFAKASKAATEESLAAQVTRLDAVETQARDAAGKAQKAGADTANLQQAAATAFADYRVAIEGLRADLKTIQDAAAKKPVGGSTGPVVAGKDEYVVKSGDIGGTIAKATGFTTAQIAAVNPGLDWNKLKVGQKLKLPAKK